MSYWATVFHIWSSSVWRRVSLDLASSLETSQHGGKFSIAPNFNINAPSVFLRRFFPYGVIIVQCGFFMYCATINVLPFRYQTGTQQDPSDVESELEKACTKMKTQTHIVSCKLTIVHANYDMPDSVVCI